MKTAAELANKAVTTYTENSTGSRPKDWQPKKRTLQLFEVLRGMFTDQWTKKIGTEKRSIENTQRIWERKLEKLTGEQIAAGLEAWDSKYPPNVNEFKALCLEVTKPTPAAHRRYKALPRPEADQELVRRELKKMKLSIKPVRFNRWQDIHGMKAYA